ncbi:MAG: trypsin-like peptidase domain-containing protein [Thermodesulfobacteriota bacterium]
MAKPYPSLKPLAWLVASLAVLWLVWSQPLQHLRGPTAEPRAVTARGDLAAVEKNAIEIFQSTAPSVVYITSVELRRDFFSLNAYEIPKGTGSGFVWDDKGRIVTNFHVIEDASRVHVTLQDNTSWKAVLVGAAPEIDLAVLQISAPVEKLRPIPVGESHDLLVGQKVFAIGNPFGLDHTLTSGIVSALGREIKAVTGQTIQGVIQTDAAINPGNSGGPLLDSAGRLVGVNTAILSPAGVSAGIGFAVPVNQVNRVVPDLIKYGKILKPGMGIAIANKRLSQRMGLSGVLILKVQQGSAADKAGLRGTRRGQGGIILGDIIVGVNGVAVSSPADLARQLANYKIGEVVILKLIRDGQEFQVEVPLEAMG